MATSTVDKLLKTQDPAGLRSAPVNASMIIPAGRPVFADAATGGATNIINAGANLFLGIANDRKDNSAGVLGDLDCEYYTSGTFVLEGSGFTIADINKKIYCSDNDTITLTSAANVFIGKVSEFISGTELRIEIETVADGG